MSRGLGPITQRIVDLKVGKSTVLPRTPNGVEGRIETARRHVPGARYSFRTVDDGVVVTRIQ